MIRFFISPVSLLYFFLAILLLLRPHWPVSHSLDFGDCIRCVLLNTFLSVFSEIQRLPDSVRCSGKNVRQFVLPISSVVGVKSCLMVSPWWGICPVISDVVTLICYKDPNVLLVINPCFDWLSHSGLQSGAILSLSFLPHLLAAIFLQRAFFHHLCGNSSYSFGVGGSQNEWVILSLYLFLFLKMSQFPSIFQRSPVTRLSCIIISSWILTYLISDAKITYL